MKILILILFFVLAVYFLQKKEPVKQPLSENLNQALKTEPKIKEEFKEFIQEESNLSTVVEIFSQELPIKEQNLSLQIKPNAETNATSTLKITILPKPELDEKDFIFEKTNKKLSTKLFETKILWQNEPSWELWRDNNKTNRFVYTLSSSVYYIYKNQNAPAHLSDELSISLQKNKNNFFISINTPPNYKNKLIKDIKNLKDYFIFKTDEKKFIVAQIFERYFTRWWECELDEEGLKCENIVSKQGLSIFSNDINAYEVRLSEGS